MDRPRKVTHVSAIVELRAGRARFPYARVYVAVNKVSRWNHYRSGDIELPNRIHQPLGTRAAA